MSTNQELSTTDRDKFNLSETNKILHHIKWASALTREKKSEVEAKYKNEASEKKTIKQQAEKDREFTLKMLNIMKQNTGFKNEVNKVIIKNVFEDVQKGNRLKVRIRQMKRERLFPQPKTLKNRGYQYGFIPKKISKTIVIQK